MPGVATRKQVLQGAAAGALLGAGLRPAAGSAAPVPTAQRPDVAHRGRAIAVTRRGTHAIVAHAARPTVAITDRRRRMVRTVQLAGHPLELALSHDERLVAVTTAFWAHPGVEIIGVRDGARHARLDAGSAPFAVAFAPDARHLVVGGGEDDGSVRILGAPGFTAGRVVPVGRIPRGLVVTESAVWVAVHGEAAVARVDLRRGRVTRRLAVPELPDRIALSRDGRTLLVSHGGHDAHRVSELDLHSGHVRRRDAGGIVSAVAWGPGGRRLAALHHDDAIAVLGATGRRRLLATVAGPRGLAVAGRHAFTTSSATGAIGRVRP